MTAKEHLSRHDREIAAIRKLLLEGMKMVRQFQDENRKFHREVRSAAIEFKKSQQRTEATLDRLMKSLGRAKSNGHNGKEKS